MHNPDFYRRKNSFQAGAVCASRPIGSFLAMYGAVDLLVVGQFGSAEDVSAVSTGSQVMHTLTVVITGLSMGITVLVGQNWRTQAGGGWQSCRKRNLPIYCIFYCFYRCHGAF